MFDNPSKQPGADTANPAQTSPPAEQVDWEARFKGLQREHTKLVEADKQKDALVAQLTVEVKTIKDERTVEATDLRRQLAEKDHGLTELTTSKTSVEEQLQALTRERDLLKQHKDIRQHMADKWPGLVSSLDKGSLRVDGLEGDALETYLKTFAEDLGQRQQTAIDQTIQGDNPITLGIQNTSTVDPQTMPIQQLEGWLFAHPDDPNYDRFEQAYMKRNSSA